MLGLRMSLILFTWLLLLCLCDCSMLGQLFLRTQVPYTVSIEDEVAHWNILSVCTLSKGHHRSFTALKLLSKCQWRAIQQLIDNNHQNKVKALSFASQELGFFRRLPHVYLTRLTESWFGNRDPLSEIVEYEKKRGRLVLDYTNKMYPPQSFLILHDSNQTFACNGHKPSQANGICDLLRIYFLWSKHMENVSRKSDKRGRRMWSLILRLLKTCHHSVDKQWAELQVVEYEIYELYKYALDFADSIFIETISCHSNFRYLIMLKLQYYLPSCLDNLMRLSSPISSCRFYSTLPSRNCQSRFSLVKLHRHCNLLKHSSSQSTLTRTTARASEGDNVLAILPDESKLRIFIKAVQIGADNRLLQLVCKLFRHLCSDHHLFNAFEDLSEAAIHFSNLRVSIDYDALKRGIGRYQGMGMCLRKMIFAVKGASANVEFSE